MLLKLLILSAVGSACSLNATLIRETPSGGIVAYPITLESDTLSSDGRREAIDLIERKCRQGYRLDREGELPRVSKQADQAWQGQLSSDRLWGVQFTCKESATDHDRIRDSR